MKINLVNSFDSILDNYNGEFLKCILLDDNRENILKMNNQIKKLKGIEVVSSSILNLEIMEEGTSKGKAAANLAKYLDIDIQQVAAIGDNENDLSMIKIAGLGIAMGNATDEVKKQAKRVTASNNEDGVFYAINKFILS